LLKFLIEYRNIFRTLLDLILVFSVLRALFKVMRGTKGIFFINGLIILFIIFASSRYLQLTLFTQLLEQLLLILIVAIPIIFQSELKRALEALGRKNPMVRWFIKTPLIASESIDIIAEGANSLAKKRIGALIVIEQENPLTVVHQSGLYIDAVLSKILIEQIFYGNSPLHDGAIVIKDNRIQAAGCFLPLDNELKLPQELGSRHRAGLSLATQSDALAIIVSEETGSISIAHHGILERDFTKEKLIQKLHELIKPVNAINDPVTNSNSKTEVV